MFTLRKRGKIYHANFRIRLPNGTSVRDRKSTQCTDRHQAEDFARLYEAQLFAELVRGEVDKPATAPRTLHDALTLMAQHCASQLAAREMAQGTVNFYRLHLGHFIRLWGEDKPLVEITTGLARQYVQTRLTEPGIRTGATVTLHTITKELGALRIALKLAHEHQWYPHDPRAIVPTGITSQYTPRERTLTVKEIQALRKHLPAPRWAQVLFACASSAEASALDRAERVDIDLARGFVVVRGSKTARRVNRRVPVVLPLCRQWLKTVLDLADGAGPRLFSRWHNRNRDVAAACRAAGIPHCSPNDWRRTYATLHTNAGVSNDTLKHGMGHSTTKMLDLVYEKPAPEDVKKRMRRELKKR